MFHLAKKLTVLYSFTECIGPGDDPYSISKSFTSAAAFRFGHLHVDPIFVWFDEQYKSWPIGPLDLREAIMNPTLYFITNPLLCGLLHDKSREIDEFINRVLTAQLFALNVTSLGHDLVSCNIHKGHEHGRLSYQVFRQSCFGKFGIPSTYQKYIILSTLASTELC